MIPDSTWGVRFRRMWKSIPEKDRRELLRSFDPDNDPPRLGKISIHFNLGRVRGIGLTLLQVFFRTVEIRPQVGQRNKQEMIFPLRRVIPIGQCSADDQPVPIRGDETVCKQRGRVPNFIRTHPDGARAFHGFDAGSHFRIPVLLQFDNQRL